jgi:hypothetical protein
MWKEKLLSRKSWLRVLRTVPSTKLLFGRMLPRSAASRGAASWISSVAATRASRSVARVSSSGRKIRATCGRTSRGSSARCSPSGASLKTSMHIFDSASMKSGTNWKLWVTALRADSLARRKSGRRIGGCGSLCWPTPRQDCGNHPGRLDSLTGSAEQWSTPRSARASIYAEDQATLKARGRDGRDTLPVQALSWHTPVADRATYGGAKAHARMDAKLVGQALSWQTPATEAAGHFPPALATLPDGKSCLPYAPRLNPLFVEALMGLPIGWTDCGRSAMASFPSWSRTHSALLGRLSD